MRFDHRQKSSFALFAVGTLAAAMSVGCAAETAPQEDSAAAESAGTVMIATCATLPKNAIVDFQQYSWGNGVTVSPWSFSGNVCGDMTVEATDVPAGRNVWVQMTEDVPNGSYTQNHKTWYTVYGFHRVFEYTCEGRNCFWGWVNRWDVIQSGLGTGVFEIGSTQSGAATIAIKSSGFVNVPASGGYTALVAAVRSSTGATNGTELGTVVRFGYD